MTADRCAAVKSFVVELFVFVRGKTILFSVAESIFCEVRMGAESSNLLSGVNIDSSPILTTQDWSLHHAQVAL